MSKNWDKPMDRTIGIHYESFNQHHGTAYKGWPEIAALIGMNMNESGYMILFHKQYLAFCKIAQTPLMQALE